MLAKAELHVHLEGTAPPDSSRASRSAMACAARRHARRRRPLPLHRFPPLPADLRPGRKRHPYQEDYRDITYEYLTGVARDGGIYVELTASPDHAALVGLSDEEH